MRMRSDRSPLRLSPLMLVMTVLLAPALLRAAPPGYAIRNVTVIDVEAGKPIPNQTVLIASGKIARIGPDSDVQPPADYRVIPADGLYLMPGLFDSHVHYVDPETYGRLFIANGVTFVRDMAGFTASILETRDKLNTGKQLGPEMIATGAICDGSPPVWPFSEVCDTPDQGRAAVNKLADAGVNQIKVYSMLKHDVYLAILDEAKKRGLKPVGHVPESVPLEEAMKAGQASCEHLTGFGNAIGRLAGSAVTATQPMHSHIEGFKSWTLLPKVDRAKLDALLKLARDSGMVHCPTLVVFQGISRMSDPKAKKDRRMQYVSPSMAKFWEGGKYGDFGKFAGRGVPFMKQMVAELHRAGVPLICGTDLANPYVFAGSSLHDEMALFQDAGIPSAEVLKSATLVPAKFFGVADRLGSIKEGKDASLVLVRANPLTDIKNAKQIDAVFLRGKYYDRARLNKLLREARDAASGKSDAVETVKLEVPGEVLARGRYTLTFNDSDAGDEDFVISKSDTGYHLMAHVRPKGGWSAPCVIKMQTDPAYALQKIDWREQRDSPTVATYVAADGKIEATATVGKEPEARQSLAIPKHSIMTGPSSAMDFFATNKNPIAVGETRELAAIGFGIPSWRLEVVKLTLSREADAELERPGGKKVKARQFVSVMEIPIGKFESRSWSDDRGVLLKSVTKMPFGVIGVTLSE